MKFTTMKELTELLGEHFLNKIEGVNRARRAGNPEGDYADEDEGEGVSYDESVESESVNRARRGEETNAEYHDEDEGTGVTYETNLYSDGDQQLSVDSGESDDSDDEDDEAKSHARPSGVEDSSPFGEGKKLPSLKSVFGEGKNLLGLAEVAPPGWEDTVKKMKGKEDIENPWALAWHMKGKGAKPGGSKKK